MKLSFLIVVLSLVVRMAVPCNAQVTGAVTIDGAPPFQEQLQGLVATRQIPNLVVRVEDPTWSVGKNGELANVLVYLKANGPEKLKGLAPVKPVSVAAQGYLFLPRVVGVMVDQEIKFSNTDPMATSFHSHPVDNRPFSFGLGQNQKKVVKLRFAEIVPFSADFFPWERGWICCFEHPFFAVTGFDGKFAIDPAPPDGEYTIIAWHETGQTEKKAVTIKDRKAVVDLTIKPPVLHPRGQFGAIGAADHKQAPHTAPTSQRIADK